MHARQRATWRRIRRSRGRPRRDQAGDGERNHDRRPGLEGGCPAGHYENPRPDDASPPPARSGPPARGRHAQAMLGRLGQQHLQVLADEKLLPPVHVRFLAVVQCGQNQGNSNPPSGRRSTGAARLWASLILSPARQSRGIELSQQPGQDFRIGEGPQRRGPAGSMRQTWPHHKTQSASSVSPGPFTRQPITAIVKRGPGRSGSSP